MLTLSTLQVMYKFHYFTKRSRLALLTPYMESARRELNIAS